jgi:hypothetical protein
MSHFVKENFANLAIFSTPNFINLPFHQQHFVTLPFVTLPLIPLVISSTGYVVSLLVNQFVKLSHCLFIGDFVNCLPLSTWPYIYGCTKIFKKSVLLHMLHREIFFGRVN